MPLPALLMGSKQTEHFFFRQWLNHSEAKYSFGRLTTDLCSFPFFLVLFSSFFFKPHEWGSNRWRDRVQGWWGRKTCNIYSFASLLSFTVGVEWGSERKNKPAGTRTRASRASFANQSALIGSTSCQGYADSSFLTYLSLSTLASPPVFSLRVNFYSPFTVCLPPSPLVPSAFPLFLSVMWSVDG